MRPTPFPDLDTTGPGAELAQYRPTSSSDLSDNEENVNYVKNYRFGIGKEASSRELPERAVTQRVNRGGGVLSLVKVAKWAWVV